MASLSIGSTAPDFDLPLDDGTRLTLSNLRGRKVVLFFYPKDDTSGCTTESLDFTRLKPAFDAAGTAVIGISPDSVKSHCKFRDKHNLAVPLAADEDKTTLQTYGVWVEKSMYGRKYMGVERTTVLIDKEGKIAQIWPKVSVTDHAAQVLKAAESL